MNRFTKSVVILLLLSLFVFTTSEVKATDNDDILFHFINVDNVYEADDEEEFEGDIVIPHDPLNQLDEGETYTLSFPAGVSVTFEGSLTIKTIDRVAPDDDVIGRLVINGEANDMVTLDGEINGGQQPWDGITILSDPRTVAVGDWEDRMESGNLINYCKFANLDDGTSCVIVGNAVVDDAQVYVKNSMLDIDGTNADGFEVLNSGVYWFRNNLIDGPNAFGISCTDALADDDANFINYVICNNVILDAEHDGILISDGWDGVIANNIIEGPENSIGIQADDQDEDARIINNTIDDFGIGIAVGVDGNMEDDPECVVLNNIIINSSSFGIQGDDADLDLEIDNNYFWNNDDNMDQVTDGGSNIEHVEAASGLVAADDYHLLWDCTAINQGDGNDDPDGSDNDIGAFGGPLADDFNRTNYEDYCVIESAEVFPDEGTLPYDTYHVLGNCSVPAGDEFTITAGATLKFENSAAFSVTGTLTSDGTGENQGQLIKYTIKDAGETWTGFKLYDGSADSRFNYCEIEKAVNGIRVISETLTNRGDGSSPIKNCKIHDCTTNGLYLSNSTAFIGGDGDGCTFTDNGIGIFISGDDDDESTITHCTISGGTIGMKIQFTDDKPTVSNCSFEEFSSYGIYVYSEDEYIISNNTIDGDDSEDQIGIFFSAGGGVDADFSDNTITNCDYGVKAYSSDPTLAGNHIGANFDDDDNNQNNIGLNLYSTSALRMGTAGSTNSIYHNDEYEIQVDGEYVPDIDEGDNNIFNDDAVEYIHGSTDWNYWIPIQVEENWWGDVPDDWTLAQIQGKCRDSNNDYLPLDFEPYLEDRAASFDDVRFAFKNAAEYEHEGDFETAEEIYREICEDHSDSYYATLSLQRIFDITSYTGGSFAELRRFFEQCGRMVEDTLFCKRANDMAAYAMVRNGDYEDAIEYYEGIIENPPCFRDSVYAVIDAGLAYYDAYWYLGEEPGGDGVDGMVTGRLDSPHNRETCSMVDGVPLFGSIASLRPENDMAMNEKMRQLLNEISAMGNLAVEPAVAPEQFLLMQNFPNPFNNVTNVRFSVPEAGHVKLALFDVNGRQVMLLNDGDMQSGTHQISFDAKGLSSGTYILRLDAVNDTQSIPTMLLK